VKGLLLALLGALSPGQDEAARLAQEVFALDSTDEAAALAVLERALALAPNRKEVLRAALFLHLRLRDLESAEAFGARALEADPSDPEVQVWLGNVAFWKGDLEGAARRYEEALARARDEAFARDVEAKRAQVGEERAYRSRARSLARRSLACGAGAVVVLLAGCGAILLSSRDGASRRALNDSPE
jgi:tetratricopeptide (TPR) repeat protein